MHFQVLGVYCTIKPVLNFFNSTPRSLRLLVPARGDCAAPPGRVRAAFGLRKASHRLRYFWVLYGIIVSSIDSDKSFKLKASGEYRFLFWVCRVLDVTTFCQNSCGGYKLQVGSNHSECFKWVWAVRLQYTTHRSSHPRRVNKLAQAFLGIWDSWF